MRYRKVKLSCVMLGIFLLLFSVPASAEIDSPFEIDETASYDTGMAFYDLRLQYETEEYTGDGQIESFDVNQNGEIIVIIDGSETFGAFGENGYRINCYRRDGSFSHCIKVDPLAKGGILALFDRSDGQLLLYDFQTDVLYKINNEGECVEAEQVPKDFNAASIIVDVRSQKEKTVNGVRYSMSATNRPFQTPTLTMTLPDGEVKTVFEYTEGGSFSRLIVYIVAVYLLAVALFFTYKLIKHMRKKKREKDSQTASHSTPVPNGAS